VHRSEISSFYKQEAPLLATGEDVTYLHVPVNRQ